MIPNWKRPTLREYLYEELERPLNDQDQEMILYDEAREKLLKTLINHDHQLHHCLRDLTEWLEEKMKEGKYQEVWNELQELKKIWRLYESTDEET